MTKPPKPEVITDRIERCKLEIKRLRLLLKISELELEPQRVARSKEPKPPQDHEGCAK